MAERAIPPSRAKELVTRHPRSGHLDEPKTITWTVTPFAAPYTGRRKHEFDKPRSLLQAHVRPDNVVAGVDLIVDVVLHRADGSTRTLRVTAPVGEKSSRWTNASGMRGVRGDWLTVNAVQGTDTGAEVQVRLT